MITLIVICTLGNSAFLFALRLLTQVPSKNMKVTRESIHGQQQLLRALLRMFIYNNGCSKPSPRK